jgi:hypothetical protein
VDAEEFEGRPGLSALFARQARAAEENGSWLYAGLCRAASLDLATRSLLTRLLAPWDDARAGDMVPLRVLAAAHRLVLERGAPALALWFPSVGGTTPSDGASRSDCYTAWVEVLAANVDRLPALLAAPPQTNDPGRSAALAGVLHLVDDAWHLPIRLHELGTSAGLNLRADLVRVRWLGGAVGPPDSPLALDDAWRGEPLPPAAHPRVVERVGSDLEPVDVATTEGRLHLTSFVWPDQEERFERLRDAYELAERTPVELRRADLLDHLRSLRPVAGSALVVWHSSTWMYLADAQRAAAHAAFERLGALATVEAPVVHAAREYVGDRLGSSFAVVTRWWPAPASHAGTGFASGTAIQHADSPAHGLPVTWMPPRAVEIDDL